MLRRGVGVYYYYYRSIVGFRYAYRASCVIPPTTAHGALPGR